MNNERNEQMVRLMAIVGFVVMVCILAWLAVQVVRFIPTAFSSLASLFEANQRDYNDRVNDTPVVIVDDTDDTDDVVVDEDDFTSGSVATSTPVVTTPATSTPVVTNPKPTTPPVQYKTVVTYKTPVSDPNGYTDLAVSFSSIGYINDSGRFVATTELGRKDNGAIQFVVKNIGTKTSTEWSFVAELPNGSTMTSKTQLPLKPGESSTLTVVFGETDARGSQYVGATATGGADRNISNNGFRTKVRVR